MFALCRHHQCEVVREMVRRLEKKKIRKMDLMSREEYI